MYRHWRLILSGLLASSAILACTDVRPRETPLSTDTAPADLAEDVPADVLDTGNTDVAGSGDTLDITDTPFEPVELPAMSCNPVSLEAPTALVACDVGSGVFGRWIVDDHGLPAYDYRMVQAHDPRAVWETTANKERRDHLFQIGNDRLIVVVDNDGYVQLLTRDRGPVLLNRVSRGEERVGGGFSYIAEGDAVWATAHGLRPAAAETRRVYGVGHVELTTTHDELEVVHRLHAPFGDHRAVVDEVVVRNLSTTRTRELRHYEVWDTNRHPLELQLVRSGVLDPGLPATFDRERNGIARVFEVEAIEAPEARAVRLRHTWVGTTEPVPDSQPSDRDFVPDDILLARLEPASPSLRMHTDRDAFLGPDEDLARPAAVLGRVAPGAPLPRQPALGQPGVLVDELELSLAPGESTTLRYAFGYAGRDEALTAADLEALPSLEDTASAWRASVPWVALDVGDDGGALQREMVWHAAQLLQNLTYDGYLDSHMVAQGGAYLFLHGLDGAARDFALFAVAMTWLRPEMAREQLRTIAAMTYASDHQISYALAGRGSVSTALIHHHPSDLDLFFLWALHEYVAVTGDVAFLDEQVALWPRDATAPVSMREHAAIAVRHLRDEVGLGPHGLIRLHTGDWSDGITFQAPDHEVAVEQGESIPNSQMATWVLPRAAALVEPLDAALASDALALATDLRTRLADEWVGQWYRRAWFGPDAPYGEGSIDLEAQIWALIAELPDDAQRASLLSVIADRLEATSGVGARRVPGGMIWHAITGLLTWGYAQSAPEHALAALRAHTMARYAERNPEQWYGIWSGPDGIGPNGGTWASEVTPMRDWPVHNANQHALPLLAMVRVAGLEPLPEGDGVRLRPALGEVSGAIELPGVSLRVDADGLSGTWRTHHARLLRLVVEAPAGASIASASLDGQPVAVDPDATEVVLAGDLAANGELAFEVQW